MQQTGSIVMGHILLQTVAGQLPVDITALRSDAASEGYRFIERLVIEWNAGVVLFNKPGEILMVARVGGIIAGIGGVTADPFEQAALRMRHFYVRPYFRRRGVAGKLATALLGDALKTGCQLTVNAGTQPAYRFWESLGFQLAQTEHRTHIWERSDP